MKKILASLVLIAATIISTSFAADIGNVALRFCNTGTLEKTIFLTTSGQEEKDVCMTLINWWNENVNISISFVDGTITNDADQKKACKNEWENENFGKYMHIDNNIISVPAKWAATFTGKLRLPEEAAWEIHGCVTYFVANNKKQQDMFNIMVRRANFIDIFAKGVVTIWLKFIDIETQNKNLSDNPKIFSSYNKDEKKLYIQSILRNTGTAEQWITIKWEIKNRFGFKKTFFEEKRTLFAKQDSNINTVVDNLPFYKGPYTITLRVEHSANLQEWLQTDDNAKEWNLTQTANILVLTTETYIFLVAILVVIALIIIIIKRRSHGKKKIVKKWSHKKIASSTTKKVSHKKAPSTAKKVSHKKK